MDREEIYVTPEEESMAEALAYTEDYAASQGFAAKESLRIRLLTEELLGMLAGITDDDFRAMFRIEGDQKKTRLYLSGTVDMTVSRREALIASSKDRKNAAATGIIGKLKDMIATAVLSFDESAQIVADAPVTDFYNYGMEMMAGNTAQMAWSLAGYRNSLEEQYIDLDKTDDFEDREPWDELERSVLANLADDVRVSIRKDHVEIVVERSVGK